MRQEACNPYQTYVGFGGVQHMCYVIYQLFKIKDFGYTDNYSLLASGITYTLTRARTYDKIHEKDQILGCARAV